MIQGIINCTKQWKQFKKKEKWLHRAIIYYRGVCVAIYDYLNSVFAADQDTSNKTREKTKGDKKKVQAAGMYINCLFKILLVIHNSN